MKYKQPYFITPHAVKQFKSRIADLPAAVIINTLQSLMQKPGIPVDAQIVDGGSLTLTYQFEINGAIIYIPVTRGEGAWPSVPTIMNEFGRLHQTITRERRSKNRNWKPKHSLKLDRLLDAGFSIGECAYILRFPISTVEQEAKKIDNRNILPHGNDLRECKENA